MPGIISAFSFNGSQKKAKEVVESVSASMFAGMGQENREIRTLSDGKVAICVRSGANDNYGYFSRDDIGLTWFGNPAHDGNLLTNKSLSSKLPSSFAEVIKWSSKLTGHFQLVLFDGRRHEFTVVTDFVSAVPMYWTLFSDTVVVTPEVLSMRSLKKMGWKPELRENAVFEMLSSCHLLGDGTYLKEVSRVGPATVVSWNNLGHKSVGEYFRFPAEKPLRKRNTEWVELLSESIQKDFDIMPKGKYGLTLSGGYDSRAMMAILDEKDIPFETVSYNFGDDFVNDFDDEVAKYFSKKVGKECQIFLGEPTKSDALIKNIQDCVVATGGENETVISQYAFLGRAFFDWMLDRNDVLLRGDEVWGWGDNVNSEGMAFWRTSLFSFKHIPLLAGLMKQDAYKLGLDWIESWKESTLEEIQGEVVGYNNLKDYLYWRVREARVISSLTYYPRCHIVHQAPFVYGNSIALCGSLPTRLRENKKLFRRTMEKRYPSLFLDKTSPTKAQPRSSARSIALKQPRFKTFVRDLLIDNPPEIFDELFHKTAIENLLLDVEEETPSVHKEKRQYDMKRIVYDALRKNQWAMSRVMASLEKAGKATFPVQSTLLICN